MTRAIDEVLDEAVARGRARAAEGRIADYIPELAKADAMAVAAAVSTVDGEDRAAGDSKDVFTLQSVSKVFSLAAVLRDGDRSLFEHVDMEPSGDAFHSIVRLEEERGRPRNPLINAGAIVVSGDLRGATATEKIAGLQRFLREAAGSPASSFEVDQAVYESERATGFRNRALAHYMTHFGTLVDPDTAVDAYFRQCALQTNVIELARLGLFLAHGGLDPRNALRLVPARANRTIVALMATCGLYDEVGRFAVDVGVPAKSGVSGAVLAVIPGRMAIAAYGPALGPKGNSVAGIEILRSLAGHLDLSIYGTSS